MVNLFWKQKDKKTYNLLSKPFDSEEEFEKTIFDTKELLEDIFLVRRQIRGGKKTGIPDIIGIDKDGNVCIVEMKNVNVDASIIHQVLDYAIWAENNPDSIKSLLYETDHPDDISIEDDYDVRIIVIAPSIDRSTLKFANKINYSMDLIEIKRWVEDSSQFLLVNKLEDEPSEKVRPVRGLGLYDREFFEKHYNKKSVASYFELAGQVNTLLKEKNWPLEMKFNKHYCGFKYGFFIAFGIKWLGSKSFALFFKLPKTVAEKEQPRGLIMDKYEDRWKEAIYKIEPSKTKVNDFLPLFEKTLEFITKKEE